MDLSTEYLGLTLRNPLVASPSPLSKTVDGVRRLADAGVGAVVLYSLFEEQLRRAGGAGRGAGRGRLRELRRGAVVLPGRGRGGARAARLREPARARRGRRRRPGDRQPQRRHARGLGRLRPGDAGRRRRRDRAEHLLPARRPAHLRPRRRAAPPRRPGARQGRGDGAGGGQARPLLQLDRGDGAAAGRGRRGRAGALQPVPAARHRPRDPRRGLGRCASPARPRRGCRAPGSRCCADGSRASLAATTGVETSAETSPSTSSPARTSS